MTTAKTDLFEKPMSEEEQQLVLSEIASIGTDTDGNVNINLGAAFQVVRAAYSNDESKEKFLERMAFLYDQEVSNCEFAADESAAAGK